jgi:hypothetical protein
MALTKSADEVINPSHAFISVGVSHFGDAIAS